MSEPLRIGVDLDGVLADWNSSFARALIRVTGRDLLPRLVDFEPPYWDWPSYYGYTKAEVAQTREVTGNELDFWAGLGAYPGAPETLRLLKLMAARYDHIYFITDRYGASAKRQTEGWLGQMGFSGATVLISPYKGDLAAALRLTHFIDDKIENCIDVVLETLAQTLLIDRPWNTDNQPQWSDLRNEGNSIIRRVADVATAVEYCLLGHESLVD